MNSGVLTKYSASAGSGKTTRLTQEYISKLFRSGNSYRRILAVTFTNKAAAEMKGRIIDQLHNLSLGRRPDEALRLASQTGKTREQVETEAKSILENILHDYSRFSVGTIDSFFQKVLKSFAKESGLQTGFSIELDHSQILSSAVDNMMAGLGEDKKLQGWIGEFAKTRVEEGKSWRIKDEIVSLAQELFREKYKLLAPEEKEKQRDRIFLAEYVKEIKSIRFEFNKHLILSGENIRKLLDKHCVTDDMFFQGRKGVPSFIRKISGPLIDSSEPLNSYIGKVLDNPPKWTTVKVPSPQLAAAMADGLDLLIINAVSYYCTNFMRINTADAILSNIYTLGILSDVLEEIHKITTAENKFLLSDAGELLWLIIGQDQTPFIYEKIGNSYSNYMIDEFQDTSAIQWQNFKPLIDNSMGEGFNSLVVGDVKQSIYRWRNSDWRIFDSVIDQEIGAERLRTETLDTNYRSRENIVAFNNSVFSTLPQLIDKQLDNEGNRVCGLYRDARQEAGGKKVGGFISFEFIEETEECKDIILSKLAATIEKLQDNGYRGADIGILVRWNNEGSEILRYMLDYRLSVSEEKRKKYNYEIISNESLVLDQNPVICFIISMLRWLWDPTDKISRALIFRNYLLATGRDVSLAEEVIAGFSDDAAEKLFPAGFKSLLDEIRHLSLFESVEKITELFSLGTYPGNPAYLNSFQDCILDFSSSNSSEIPAFLEWWETAGSKKSVVLSEQQDSMRIMTIHKSKGLQFRAVILPFLSWQLYHDKNPTIWIRPANIPFSKLGLIPVKYKKSLLNTQFAGEYKEERFSSMVDNLNLAYVAFTRAVDCLIGLCSEKSGNRTATISSLLKSSFQCQPDQNIDKPSITFNKYYDPLKQSLSIGTIPERVNDSQSIQVNEVPVSGYDVAVSLERLKLKFHGENFLVSLPEEQAVRLNYGKLMHEVFSLINTRHDIDDAVHKLVLEGKVAVNQKEDLMNRLLELISDPGVKDWFSEGSIIIKETDILLPSGAVRRPDRIILKENGAIIIDFKFGVEKSSYINQVKNYRKLLNDMGYREIEAYIWYVDINKIITV